MNILLNIVGGNAVPIDLVPFEEVRCEMPGPHVKRGTVIMGIP